MAKSPSLVTVRATFDRRLDSALDLCGAVYKMAEGDWNAIQGYEALYPGQARRVVGLAFLQMLICWEDFVESCLIRYLMGASSPKGYAPVLRLAPAASVSHAYQLATGDPGFLLGRHYTKWSSWSDIVSRSGIYLKGGAPFATLSPAQRDRLADATKIRNRVAHASVKARSDFVEVAIRHLGLPNKAKLPQGFTVGQLLINTTSAFFPGPKASYFEHYHDLFKRLGDHICP